MRETSMQPTDAGLHLVGRASKEVRGANGQPVEPGGPAGVLPDGRAEAREHGGGATRGGCQGGGEAKMNFRGVRWTPEEDATLNRMMREGRSYREISVALDRRTEWSVKKRAGERKIPKAVKSKRSCMCCSKVFQSSGSMNRLCDRCRSVSIGPYERLTSFAS